jgi:hypothetical protein
MNGFYIPVLEHVNKPAIFSILHWIDTYSNVCHQNDKKIGLVKVFVLINILIVLFLCKHDSQVEIV